MLEPRHDNSLSSNPYGIIGKIRGRQRVKQGAALKRVLVIKHGALGNIVRGFDAIAGLHAGLLDAHLALLNTPLSQPRKAHALFSQGAVRPARVLGDSGGGVVNAGHLQCWLGRRYRPKMQL